MQEQFLNVAGKKMRCLTATPIEPAKKAVILLQEAFGLNTHMESLVQRFAEQGYRVIAPELFHRTAEAGAVFSYADFMEKVAPHFSALTEEGLTEDVGACLEWLKSAHGVTQVAVVGYCMGGRAAIIANGCLKLQAAVSYYGGRVPSYLHLAKDQKAPLLALWGGLDKGIPQEQVQLLYQELRLANKNFVGVEFALADHGFSNDERPAFDSSATKQAWALTCQFLKDNLV